jgi:Fe-S cluster assembly protein SufD
MAFEERIDVHSERCTYCSHKNFENKGFPTKKKEAWKYTSLNTLKMTLLFFQSMKALSL